jgi:hypothetical protein
MGTGPELSAIRAVAAARRLLALSLAQQTAHQFIAECSFSESRRTGEQQDMR